MNLNNYYNLKFQGELRMKNLTKNMKKDMIK